MNTSVAAPDTHDTPATRTDAPTPPAAPAPLGAAAPAPPPEPSGLRRRGKRPLRTRALRWAGRLAAASAFLSAAGWLVGRFINDDHAALQALWWLPSELVALACALGFAVSALCETLGLRTAGARLRPFLPILAVAIFGWTALAEWRLHRFVLPPTAPAGPTFRIAYLNLAWTNGQRAAATVLGLNADLTIIANPNASRGRRELADTLSAHAAQLARQHASAHRDDNAAPDPAHPLAAAFPTPTHLATARGATIISRSPILRTGGVGLPRLPGDHVSTHNSIAQNGVAFVEIDTTAALGRTTVVWIVDLPSNPFIHRRVIMQAAADAAKDLPAADVILGDFNTTRGSRSLSLLVGDRAESHAAAGRGPARTWPRPVPSLSIDLAFAGEPWRFAASRPFSAGRSLHQGLLINLAAPSR